MGNNFKFKKNDYVRVDADRYNVFSAFVSGAKVVNGNNMYLINGTWYYEKNIMIAKKPALAPTDYEMAIIKKEYPILKKDNIKIIYEHGDDVFGFIFEKGDQKGKFCYSHGEFTIMSDKRAREYGYIF